MYVCFTSERTITVLKNKWKKGQSVNPFSLVKLVSSYLQNHDIKSETLVNYHCQMWTIIPYTEVPKGSFLLKSRSGLGEEKSVYTEDLKKEDVLFWLFSICFVGMKTEDAIDHFWELVTLQKGRKVIYS